MGYYYSPVGSRIPMAYDWYGKELAVTLTDVERRNDRYII